MSGFSRMPLFTECTCDGVRVIRLHTGIPQRRIEEDVVNGAEVFASGKQFLLAAHGRT